MRMAHPAAAASLASFAQTLKLASISAVAVICPTAALAFRARGGVAAASPSLLASSDDIALVVVVVVVVRR
jgi:hypothetical protein